RDHTALTRLLQSAGYDVEALTVQVAEPDRSATASGPSAQQGPSQQNAYQTPSGGAQPDGRSGGAHQGSHQNDSPAGAKPTGPPGELPTAGTPERSGIFL